MSMTFSPKGTPRIFLRLIWRPWERDWLTLRGIIVEFWEKRERWIHVIIALILRQFFKVSTYHHMVNIITRFCSICSIIIWFIFSFLSCNQSCSQEAFCATFVFCYRDAGSVCKTSENCLLYSKQQVAAVEKDVYSVMYFVWKDYALVTDNGQVQVNRRKRRVVPDERKDMWPALININDEPCLLGRDGSRIFRGGWVVAAGTLGLQIRIIENCSTRDTSKVTNILAKKATCNYTEVSVQSFCLCSSIIIFLTFCFFKRGLVGHLIQPLCPTHS